MKKQNNDTNCNVDSGGINLRAAWTAHQNGMQRRKESGQNSLRV